MGRTVVVGDFAVRGGLDEGGFGTEALEDGLSADTGELFAERAVHHGRDFASEADAAVGAGDGDAIGFEIVAVRQRGMDGTGGGFVADFFERIDDQAVDHADHAAAMAGDVLGEEALFGRADVAIERDDAFRDTDHRGA